MTSQRHNPPTSPVGSYTEQILHSVMIFTADSKLNNKSELYAQFP